MSVERLPISVDHGETWRVSWRDERGYLRSRWAPGEAEARILEADVKIKQDRGEMDALERGGQTVREFVAELSSSPELRQFPGLSRGGLRKHLDESILPQLGVLPLADLTPTTIAEFLQLWTGDQAVLVRLRTVLSLILEQAVRWQRLRLNPTLFEKPDCVELMRNWLIGVDRFQDAVLVTTLAYTGLGFEEAVALEWGHVHAGTLVVEQARTVTLIAPFATDLERLRAQVEDPAPEVLVFTPPQPEGNWDHWRQDVFLPAAELAGATGMELSDLRTVFHCLDGKGGDAESRVYAVRETMVQGVPSPRDGTRQ